VLVITETLETALFLVIFVKPLIVAAFVAFFPGLVRICRTGHENHPCEEDQSGNEKDRSGQQHGFIGPPCVRTLFYSSLAW
jgi:hypothetical protein